MTIVMESATLPPTCRMRVAWNAEYSSFRSVFNFIPYPPYRFDKPGLVHAVPQLFPQMADVDGDGVVGFAVILVLPDFVKQFLRADHVPGVLQENTQDRKFRRCQHQRFFVQEAGVRLDIHGQVAADDGVRLDVRRRSAAVGTG